jgi:hypothetical protein
MVIPFFPEVWPTNDGHDPGPVGTVYLNSETCNLFLEIVVRCPHGQLELPHQPRKSAAVHRP